jgi:tetratricopeptide (TPR) repeat protein
MTMPPSDRPTTPDPNWDRHTLQRLAVEYCELGDTFLATQDYDRAKSAYQIAIDYDPQLAIAYNGIARAEYFLGNYDTALMAIDLAIAHSPQIDFYDCRTLINNALNDDDRSLANTERQIPSFPQNLVDWRSNELEFDRVALANFDTYIEAHPQDAEGYCYRGLYYDRLERYHLALADFDRAISLQPDRALFHYARSCTRQHLGC